MEGRLSHQHTHAQTQSAANKKFYESELSNLTLLVKPLFILTLNLKKP
jgi:hypothetical protein